MADALVELAESYLEHGCENSSSADRYQVVVHVSAETLKSDVADGGVSAETPAAVCEAVRSPAGRAPEVAPNVVKGTNGLASKVAVSFGDRPLARAPAT